MIFDAVRQFGPKAAMRVVQAAKQCGMKAIVAFGIGGDELSIPPNNCAPYMTKPQRWACTGLFMPAKSADQKKFAKPSNSSA